MFVDQIPGHSHTANLGSSAVPPRRNAINAAFSRASVSISRTAKVRLACVSRVPFALVADTANRCTEIGEMNLF